MDAMRELYVKTSRQEEMVDITSLVQRELTAAGASNGLCFIFVPHTTCGLTINERVDPEVVHDILAGLRKIVPDAWDYRHGEGNSPAHIKTSLLGTSQTILVAGGRLQLGTWQGIFLCEFDGPRQRKVWIKFIEG